MSISNTDFVEMANPHSWFLVADDLHSQACQLRENHGSARRTKIDYNAATSVTLDATNRSVFLLSSFALENAIKAFLVYENPEWISNGKLARGLRTHKLTQLSNKSTLIPYKQRGQKTLRVFEDGIDSWARYPCSLSKDETKKPLVLTDKLWNNYRWLILAYGKRLQGLLAKDWHGPHGCHGYYNIDDDFLL
jgi:hypothetical protein